MANIKPKQLEFLDWEFGVFFHFGIRTFNEGHTDWDGREMDVSSFNPEDLDCDLWIRTIKAAGAKYAVLTTKHHDGFANWPSKYTEFSVKNTPWKNGHGDVVREYTDACHRHGIKCGLYYSPAQHGFSTMNGKEYDDYFINQITELLTEYGKIDYIWFDGCGSEGHRYDTVRIVNAIRSLAPDIMIFNMWDPDTKWVGNESGLAHSPNKLTVSNLDFSINSDIKDLLDEPRFLPSECDFRMRHHNWFYSALDENEIKSVDELMGIYYYSVGRGANFLINIGPDRKGRLPKKDSEILLSFGEKVRTIYESILPATSKLGENATELSFEEHTLVNHVIIGEELTGNDEIEYFEIKIHPYEYGAPITVYRGTTIGHKAIAQFPTVRTKKIEIITDKKNKISASAAYIPIYK